MGTCSLKGFAPRLHGLCRAGDTTQHHDSLVPCSGSSFMTHIEDCEEHQDGDLEHADLDSDAVPNLDARQRRPSLHMNVHKSVHPCYLPPLHTVGLGCWHFTGLEHRPALGHVSFALGSP